jgi:hypothetical protein
MDPIIRGVVVDCLMLEIQPFIYLSHDFFRFWVRKD